MAGGGAVVAIMVAAHQEKLRKVVDAFRLAGATAPERARPLPQLGLARDAALDELAQAGVLAYVKRDDAWWLNEAAYVARRDARPAKGKLLALIVLLALLAVAAGTILATRH